MSTKYICQFLNSGTEKEFSSKTKAMQAAATYVGNNSYAAPFGENGQLLYGPGNGETSVIVLADMSSE